MTDLLQDYATEYARGIAQWKSDTIRHELEKTDWEETAVIDFVWTREMATTMNYSEMKNLSMGLGLSVAVVRHDSQAPKYEDLQPVKDAVEENRRSEVQRITEPLLNKFEEEYDLGIS